MNQAWLQLQHDIVTCSRCPRLREHCQAMATQKRAAFRDQKYWGKPLPNLGSRDARLLVVGLAPAAHGGNRTGRMFTGDRSGDFLFRAMYEAGFANQPNSDHKDDGLELIDAAITGVAHCAPPDNKPTPVELATCSTFLDRTIDLMPNLRCVFALGRIAFDACLRTYRARGWLPRTSETVGCETPASAATSRTVTRRVSERRGKFANTYWRGGQYALADGVCQETWCRRAGPLSREGGSPRITRMTRIAPGKTKAPHTGPGEEL